MIFQGFLANIWLVFLLVYATPGCYARMLAETITDCVTQIGSTCAECDSSYSPHF